VATFDALLYIERDSPEPDHGRHRSPRRPALPFEKAIEELESIVKRLEEGKVPLEESVAITSAARRSSAAARSCCGKPRRGREDHARCRRQADRNRTARRELTRRRYFFVRQTSVPKSSTRRSGRRPASARQRERRAARQQAQQRGRDLDVRTGQDDTPPAMNPS